MKDTPQSAGAERRTETRLDDRATIFIELLATDYDQREPAQISICSSVDISANGMQVRLDQPVEVGSILRLCAEFPDGRPPIYLVGEVKWLRPDGEDYCAGFALFESEQTDIIAWKQVIAERFGDQ